MNTSSLNDLIHLAHALSFGETGERSDPETLQTQVRERGDVLGLIGSTLKAGEELTAEQYGELLKVRDEGNRFRRDLLALRNGLYEEQRKSEAALARAARLSRATIDPVTSLRVEA